MSDGLADMMCCASCGKAEVDDVKLMICTACRLVKYCSVDCQKNHRPQHKKACRKRLAEIRDDNLFKQPDESYLGECPICCLPLSLDPSTFIITKSCCCKIICKGCAFANQTREVEQGLERKCVYCRQPLPKTQEDQDQNLMKRANANDPSALCDMGMKCRDEGDHEKAFEYFTKAAEQGDVGAHYELSVLYDFGEGVEKMKKAKYHMEEAAIRGHPDARFNLGRVEEENGRPERAMKHYIIAANLGDDEALEEVKKGFQRGWVSNEDYSAALRGHQAAVDATKSEQREAEYIARQKYFRDVQHGNQ